MFLATGRDGCVATGDVYYGVTPDAMQRRCICNATRVPPQLYRAAASARCASVSTPATSSVRRSCVAGWRGLQLTTLTRSKRRTRNCQNAPLTGLLIIAGRYSRVLRYCSPISNRSSRATEYSRKGLGRIGGHKSRIDAGRKCVAENRPQNARSHANFTHLKSFRAIFALALNIKSDLL